MLSRAPGALRPALRLPLASTSALPISHRSYAQKSWDDSPAQPTSYSTAYQTRYERERGPVKPKSKKQVPSGPGPPPSEDELARRAVKRIARAERLERKDLTAQLTPTKTYMGGFTQPRHLAFLNYNDNTRKEKDSYGVRVGADRVRPAPEAYEPHCVYLAVTRYPVRWGHGRATRRECFSGFCKESELGERMRQLNWGIWREADPKKPETTAGWTCSSDSKEYLDLAVWPGSPEARSLANKTYYQKRKSIAKEQAAEASEVSGEKVPLDLNSVPATLLPEFLPAVGDFTRPSPPYFDLPLIVPLLTLTLPTRPLASTLSRLCNGHPRGLPFIASVPNEDRKDGPPLFRRLLRMRINRIKDLTGEIVQKLDGYGGGFFGLRLGSEDKGRGVEGESLGQEMKSPEGGWAKVTWLDEGSECWEGIEREAIEGDWKVVEGVREGERWTDAGRVVGAETIESSDEGASIIPPTQVIEQSVEARQ